MNAHTQNENTAALVGTIEEDRHELVAINPYERMMETIINRGGDMAALKDMMDLRDRWEATEARKAFVDAMASFKVEPIDLRKSKAVGYDTKDGDFVGYKHATTADVVDAVVPAMGRNGLSHRWDVKQEDGQITVTCIITHKLGHSESVAMTAAPDNSGKKNPIQQVASTIQYLQRYTLMAATGVAAKEQDDDAITAYAAPGPEPDRISEEQEATLSGLIASTDSSLPKYLEWLKIDKLSDLRASSYGRALALLKTKQGIIDKKESEA